MTQDPMLRRSATYGRTTVLRPVRPIVVPPRASVTLFPPLERHTVPRTKIDVIISAPGAVSQTPFVSPTAVVSELRPTVISTHSPGTSPEYVRDNASRKKRVKHSFRHKLISAATYSFAAIAIFLGSVLAWQTLQTNTTARAQVDQIKQESRAIVPSGDGAPSAPKVAGPYQVASDLPKFLSIPRLGLKNTQIVQVGMKKDGSIGSPVTATQVAWYNGSAKPGVGTGAMFIDGHVEASTQHPDTGSVFSHLDKLVAGDTITLTRGDNTEYTFTVVKTAKVPVANIDMSVMLNSANPNKLGLNLMTCAGSYQRSGQTFDHRTEVFAVQSN